MWSQLTSLPTMAGGLLIAISASLLMLFNGRIAGISGILNGILYTKHPDKHWRILFIIGLLAGGLLFQIIIPNYNLPRENYPRLLLVIGGFLIGIGTRLANGCVSGHGICGISLLAKRSLLATTLFMLSGMITVYIMRHVLGVI